MLVESTKLDGVKKIYPPTVFEDFRGVYIETYNKNLYVKAGIKENFIQDIFTFKLIFFGIKSIS